MKVKHAHVSCSLLCQINSYLISDSTQMFLILTPVINGEGKQMPA
jgi:hypothetical protein